ncbi:MAG TPA: alpha/beta hydrolase [Lysobacter sp.]|jgi:acetyl esterase/lipase|nr:alpha/beta hydrolase [Lysobacter sp.]
MTEDSSVLTRPTAAPDQVVAYGDAPDQVADVRFGSSGAEAQPLVVIVHGGFWRPQYGRDQLGPMAAALAAAGWTVAAIGYRRIPANPDASVDDVVLALERLPARVSRHDGRVIVIGHSAGGHLALLAALRPQPALAGVLALAPAADLRLAHELALGNGAVAAYLGDDPNVREDLDPQRLPSPAVATRLLHGDDDAVVPLVVSESYHAAHPDVSLQRLDCGHFALIDPQSAAWSGVVRELGWLSGMAESEIARHAQG